MQVLHVFKTFEWNFGPVIRLLMNSPYVPLTFHECPGHWANNIPVIFLSSLGSIQPWAAVKHNINLYPRRHTPGWGVVAFAKCVVINSFCLHFYILTASGWQLIDWELVKRWDKNHRLVLCWNRTFLNINWFDILTTATNCNCKQSCLKVTIWLFSTLAVSLVNSKGWLYL